MPIKTISDPTLQPLAKKQRYILSFIIYYRMKNKCMPLSSEISEFCFTGNSPSQFLLALERKNYIHRGCGKTRGIRILEIAYQYLNDSDLEIWRERDRIRNDAELNNWRKKYKI